MLWPAATADARSSLKLSLWIGWFMGLKVLDESYTWAVARVVAANLRPILHALALVLLIDSTMSQGHSHKSAPLRAKEFAY